MDGARIWAATPELRGQASRGRTLRGLSAYGALGHLVYDPIAASRRLTLRYGRLIEIDYARPRTRKPGKIFHLSHAEHAELVLKNYTWFSNGGIIIKAHHTGAHNLLRDGYFSANGKEYDHYLRLLAPHFRRKMVDHAGAAVFATIRQELDGWPVGERFDFSAQVGRLLKLLASHCLYRDGDTEAGLCAADEVERHGRLAGASARSVVEARFGGEGAHLHRQARTTYDAILRWADTRRDVPAGHDLLATIVNAPDEKGRAASPARIAGYAWTMLGAAYDTSTSILCWLMVMLARNPEVAARLHDELTGASFDPLADIEGLMELPYLDAVIKEALRLVPPAPIQRRKAEIDTQVDGREVSVGAQILLSAWMINRDPAFYPDPDAFRPERWLAMNRSPYQWLTFSAGPRRCLGIWFAYGFLKAVLAGILLRWRPDIPDGVGIDMKVAVTVRPSTGVPMVLRPQDRAFRKSSFGGSVFRYLPQL